MKLTTVVSVICLSNDLEWCLIIHTEIYALKSHVINFRTEIGSD